MSTDEDDRSVFVAYSDADHVSRLVESARIHYLDGDRDEAIRWLKEALRPAESVERRIRDAIAQLEKP